MPSCAELMLTAAKNNPVPTSRFRKFKFR